MSKDALAVAAFIVLIVWLAVMLGVPGSILL